MDGVCLTRPGLELSQWRIRPRSPSATVGNGGRPLGLPPVQQHHRQPTQRLHHNSAAAIEETIEEVTAFVAQQFLNQEFPEGGGN